jgi:hypothetical protein
MIIIKTTKLISSFNNNGREYRYIFRSKYPPKLKIFQILCVEFFTGENSPIPLSLNKIFFVKFFKE